MNHVKKIMEQREDLRELLFVKGFLLTDDADIPSDGYPFYGTWNCEQHGSFYFWSHPQTGVFTLEHDGKTFFLFGHAYNPFRMEYDESAILRRLSESMASSMDDFLHLCDELTGVFLLGFLEGPEITVLLDASGMQFGCYGSISGKKYVASHMRMIGDL